jgi:hypothetical protein
VGKAFPIRMRGSQVLARCFSGLGSKSSMLDTAKRFTAKWDGMGWGGVEEGGGGVDWLMTVTIQ